MNKKSVFKIWIGIFIILVVLLFIIISDTINRVGSYSVLTPYEELTFTEKIAAKLGGYHFDTISELNKIDCNYSKEELESMYIKPEKYIGKLLEFTGTIATDIGVYESTNEELAKLYKESDIDAITVQINNTDVLVTMIYPKNKIDYKSWTKGIRVNVKGHIKEIREDYGTSITLSDNSSIVLAD